MEEKQGTLFQTVKEMCFLENLFEKAKKIAKERLPEPVEGQSWNDYLLELYDERRLEFANQLREFADIIEHHTLEAENKKIHYLYEEKSKSVI